MSADGMTQAEVAAALGVSRTTVGRYLRALAPPHTKSPDPPVPSTVTAAKGPGTRPPSLRDVANRAGVSHQTVSRVVNDHPKVGAATRARVRAVMEEIGYRRNRAARSLVTRRTGVIGIVSDESPRYGPLRTLLALEGAIRKSDYTATVVNVEEPHDKSIPAAIARLEEVCVEGIVLIATRLVEASALRATRLRVPVVMLAAGEPSAPGLIAFSEDQELGARMATKHLIDLGHTDIVHLAGSMEWIDGVVRRQGYETEMHAAGLTPRWYEGDWSPAWAYQMGLRFVAEGLPDAIFAVSDHTALGLFRAFAEHGVAVPRDISVVGFDDVEGADHFHPPLTTVRQDFDALARRAIDLLLAATEGHPVEDPQTLAPTFTIRASTARRERATDGAMSRSSARSLGSRGSRA